MTEITGCQSALTCEIARRTTTEGNVMKPTVRSAFAAILLASSVTLAAPSMSNAATFSEKSSGRDIVTTSTTLKYEKSHGTFKLRVWVTKNAGISNWSVSDKYSIKMYDKNNRQVWSAANQVDRTYSIGSNVSRIEIKRNNAAAHQATTNWKRS